MTGAATSTNDSRPGPEALRLYDDFLARTGVDRLQKILARYELFKLVLDVPGDIVECGVFKGSGIYTWAKLQRLFHPHSERRIVGFDFFEAARGVALARRGDREVLAEHATGWTAQDEILGGLAAFGIHNVELVAGDVAETTRAYVKQHLGFRIALLYLDVDNYEGTLASLEHLFPVVTPGGIVAFDEYALRGYGESDAVDAYFRGRSLRLRTLPWANTPTAYVVKEAC
jgi:hypothetical protein